MQNYSVMPAAVSQTRTFTNRCIIDNTAGVFSLVPGMMASHTRRKVLRPKVLCPTQHKIGHFGDVFQANLLSCYGKTKPNTTKAHIHQSKEMYYNTF